MELHQLINGCLVMEGAAARIYAKFALMFPGEKQFWEDLALDEKMHEAFLIEAADRGAFEWMDTKAMPLNLALVDETRRFVSNVRQQIETQPVALHEALTISLKLEETIVEVFTNELIAGLSPADKHAILQMLGEEKNHIDKIREKMISSGFLKLV
jgi:rubrerythrin